MHTAGALLKKCRPVLQDSRAIEFQGSRAIEAEVMPRLFSGTQHAHIVCAHFSSGRPNHSDPSMAKSSRSTKTAKSKSSARNSRTTVSGPAEPDASGAGDIVAEKAAGTQDVASAFPFNPNKAAEYDPDAALAPPEGASVKPADPIVGASTVSEVNGSDKVGSGAPNHRPESHGRSP